MPKTAIEHVNENLPPPGAPVGETVHTADGTIVDTSNIVQRSWGGQGGQPSLAVRDEFTVDDEDAKAYGINLETHIPYWGRDESHEQWKREGRARQILKSYPGSYVVRPDGGDKVTIGEDLCLFAIPRPLWERREQELSDARKSYEKDLRQDPERPDALSSKRDLSVDSDGGITEYENEVRRQMEMKARMRREAEQNRALGITGERSPTHGMSLMEATRMMQSRGVDVEELQARARQGSTHVPMDQEGWQNMIAKSNSKTFSFTGSGFNNPSNSAVGQAAARANRQGGR